MDIDQAVLLRVVEGCFQTVGSCWRVGPREEKECLDDSLMSFFLSVIDILIHLGNKLSVARVILREMRGHLVSINLCFWVVLALAGGASCQGNGTLLTYTQGFAPPNTHCVGWV